MVKEIPDGSRDVADENYKRTFGTSKQLEEMEAAAAASEPESEAATQAKQASSSKEKAKVLEKQEGASDTAHWRTTKAADALGGKTKRGIIGRVRHGSAYLFIIGIIVAGAWYSSVFAPNILMVNIKEMFTNDLSDATIALWTYDKKMLDHKLGKADCGTKDSIKCKLSTMSRQQVKALEKAGFTVNGEKVDEDNRDDFDPDNDKTESRYKVTSIEFPHDGGTASSADQFEQNTNKSSAMKSLVYSVFHPKTSFFMDERFKQRLKWRYDLTKNPTVTGNTEEAVDKSFDASMKGDDEKIDDTGQGPVSLKTLESDGKSQLKDASKRIGKLANAYVGLQCAYYTQFKITYNATKKARETTVARFAMQYLKAADQIKAGLAEEMAANVLSSKLAWSDEGGYGGKNATDSAMYRHILYKESAKDSRNGLEYYLDNFSSIGKIFPAWLQTVFITEKIIKGMANLPGSLSLPPADIGGTSAREYCLEGQKDSNKIARKPSYAPNNCPVLTVSGTPPAMMAAVAPVAAIADVTCPYPPPVDKGCCWMMYPTTQMTQEIVMPYIADTAGSPVASWAGDEAKKFDSGTKGINASDAIFAGTGAILGDMAMSRGMRPGDKQSMSQYLSHRDVYEKDIEEVARYEGRKNPLDLQNKFSFMGAFVRSMGVSYDQKPSFLSSALKSLSILPTSLAHLNPKANAFFYIQPRTLDTSRLRCPDAEYKNIGIDADVACNVRYSMSQQELDAKVDDVLKYMLESHSDETKDNIDEIQKRLDETDKGFDMQDKNDVQRQLDEAKEGRDAKMIDEKTGAPVKFSEYEKFMTYCVNREDPWGRTGMAVRREELSDSEKENRLKDKDQNGNPINKSNDSGSPYEMKVANDGKSAYMSITEGAKADQDWYTGKKCLEDSEMLRNFRAYTMMCSVDGTHSGAIDCTEKDDSDGYYFDGFYNNNDVIYTSWY